MEAIGLRNAGDLVCFGLKRILWWLDRMQNLNVGSSLGNYSGH